MYPVHIVNGFPGIKSQIFWYLVIGEAVCLIDIVINFFLQEIDEEGNSRNEPLS